jgi:8-oxo-dGTP pyrophosphatase MutT (NUDIX family)
VQAASSFGALGSFWPSAPRIAPSIPVCGTLSAATVKGRKRQRTLLRELEEELGVKALAFEEIATLEEPQPAENGEANYHIFAVTAWTGEPRLLNAEHSEIRWLSLDQALVLSLAHPRYGQLFRAVLEGRSQPNCDI